MAKVHNFMWHVWSALHWLSMMKPYCSNFHIALFDNVITRFISSLIYTAWTNVSQPIISNNRVQLCSRSLWSDQTRGFLALTSGCPVCGHVDGCWRILWCLCLVRYGLSDNGTSIMGTIILRRVNQDVKWYKYVYCVLYTVGGVHT